jgi:hypothetical protein
VQGVGTTTNRSVIRYPTPDTLHPTPEFYTPRPFYPPVSKTLNPIPYTPRFAKSIKYPALTFPGA